MSLLHEERVERCARCEELTPHLRLGRKAAVLVAGIIAAGIAGVALGALGSTGLGIALCILASVVLGVTLCAMPGPACARCRWKAHRATRPGNAAVTFYWTLFGGDLVIQHGRRRR